MKKIFLIGALPPPIGGITMHIDRFLNIYDGKKYEIGVFDLKKIILYRKDSSKYQKKFLNIFKFFLKSSIVHVHVSHKLKLLIIIISKLFFKKVVYTHHNSRIENILIWKLIVFISNRIILVNDQNISEILINRDKSVVIPAFLPPYTFKNLTIRFVDEISKFDNVISTNCYRYNLFNGKDLYGFDVIIKAFYSLSMSEKITNSILVLVDPSATSANYVKRLLEGLDFKSNEVLHITEEIDFLSLIKLSTLTIRATRTDGDSLSVRESLYFGVPVVASDVTWRPKETITFKNEDIVDLSEKIVDIIQNKKNISYNNENYGIQIIHLYDELSGIK